MASGAGGKNTNTSVYRSRPPCPSRLHKEPILSTLPPIFPAHWGHLLLSPLQPVASPSPPAPGLSPFILAPFTPRQQLLGWPCGSRVLVLSTQPPTGRPAPAGPPGAPRPLADPRGGQGEATSQVSCFLGGHRAGNGATCWAAGAKNRRQHAQLCHSRSDRGLLLPSWASFPPPRGSWPLLGAGTVVSPSGGATERCCAPSRAHTAEWGAGDSHPGRGLEAGLSSWGRARAEQATHQLAAESGCLRAEVPRPPRTMGAPSTGAPGRGTGKTGAGAAGALPSGSLGWPRLHHWLPE